MVAAGYSASAPQPHDLIPTASDRDAGMAEVGAAITDLELRVTIKTLVAKGESQRAAACQLDLYEGTILYHFWCIVAGTPDGRQSAMHALCWYGIGANDIDLRQSALLHD